MKSSARRTAALLAALAVLLLAPEAAYLLGARACAVPAPGQPCAVLVLGNKAPSLQERRVGAGVAAMNAAGCGLLVVSGGKPFSAEPEADGMAAVARRLGVAEPRLALERASRNTWENVKLSLPLLERYDRIYVVSDSLHAHRGRRYLCKQRPDRCASTLAVGYNRFGDMYAYKWSASAHEAAAWLRDAFR